MYTEHIETTGEKLFRFFTFLLRESVAHAMVRRERV